MANWNQPVILPVRSSMYVLVDKIVSGGQTGADRGGLDAAIKLGIPHGGWCPRGRRAEDGKVPQRYVLRETGSTSYQVRTRRNVLDSDGTVIFTRGRLEGGSLLTQQIACETGKPCLHLDLGKTAADHTAAVQRLRAWLVEERIRILNVAGSRASMAPGLQATVARLLVTALCEGQFDEERLMADQEGELVAADSPETFGGDRTDRKS